jgi:plasmid stabilization system protein ParE
LENKKYEIIWSPKAYRNIQKIYAFTLEKLGNERYAIKIVKKILKAINSLKLFPFMYPKIYIDRKFKRQLRRATVGKYAVIYEVKNNKILILYIFHENQNYSNLLLNQENLN